MKVVAVTALGLDSKHKGHSRMVRAGTELELDGDVLQRYLDLGAVKPADEGDEITGDGSGEALDPVEVELPERPSNGATKDTWRAYLAKLNEVTKDELGDLQVPEDANRDQLIAIGDARVAEWNED